MIQEGDLMTGRDAILTALGSTKHLLNWYLSDLSDADLLVRPVPGANHLAWQLGHLAAGDIHLVKGQLPDAAYPELPAGFAETYGPDGASKDGPDGFLSKDEYIALFDRVRTVTMETVKKLSDADLDRPTTGKMAQFAPTLGALFMLVSNHTLMHVGQFTVVRRKLGKPVLF
jgi:DinB superfamily